MHAQLYPGYKNYSRLSFIIKLYLIKSRGKMNDVTFGKMVHLLENAFPDINIPDSFYETKKLITALGCDYKKIDVCQITACCFGSRMETWMLARYAMSLDGNLIRLLHWKKEGKK